MKSNKITYTIAFFIIGLFTFVSSQAQEAKTLFINVPDSLCPLLTKVNREDCIDFLSSKMKAQVENRFGQKSEMTDLSKDYIRMQMTPETTWQDVYKRQERMNEAARTLFEYIDFTSFSKLHTDVKTNICHISHAEWTKMEGEDTTWVFTIRADRFLRNMVRAIVGTLLEGGRGKLTVEGFRKVIEQQDRCKAGTSAPGNALFLVNVEYPEEEISNR